MEYTHHKSHELTVIEKEQICELFHRVFGKKMTLEQFSSKFENAVNGYSFHGVMKDNGYIVGCYSAIPYQYTVGGHSYIFGLSVDTMIDEAYRGSPFILKRLAQLVFDDLKESGIPLIFGFPNSNFYLITKKILKWQDIGELDYYMLPINIGAFKRGLNFLNPLSRLVCKTLNLVARRNGKVSSSFNIEKIVDDQFVNHRYGSNYRKIDLANDSFFRYRLYEEDGVRVAYIIDATPLDQQTIEMAVKTICANEKGSADAVIYVGKLPFRPVNLIKIPKRFEPKPVRMTGKILIPNMVDESMIFDINNWNVNLSNFDVR